ncbi:hypothetical protein SLS55_000871 [Diplodia seriata]|uniref:Uncharacterized protein n=1 Tax=Diplodia seriata TaxID=420778 RepID=A0ABR3CVK1_9PEZI
MRALNRCGFFCRKPYLELRLSGWKRHMKSIIFLDERPFNKAQEPQALNGVAHTIRMGHLAYRFEFMQYSGEEFKLMDESKMKFHYAMLHADVEDPIKQTFPHASRERHDGW